MNVNKLIIKKFPSKYPNGGEIDPITGLPVIIPTGDLTGNIWNTGVSNSPINPNTDPNSIIPINQQGTTTASNQPIVPLTQFYDQYTMDRLGNQGLRPNGEYVNSQGQMTTTQQNQNLGDQISEQNRENSSLISNNLADIERGANIGITTINALLQRNSQGQQRRKTARDIISQEIYTPINNPYAEGTGSQAIMKNGGKVMKKYPNGGELSPDPPTGNYRDPYYEANARLSYFKDQLNSKLKAKNPTAFTNYFKGMRESITASDVKNPNEVRRQYIQNNDYNEYLSPEEVKSTLGDKYNTYLSSLDEVNSYNVAQGLQPLYGDIEGENDINKLNYGRRFASLSVVPSVASTITTPTGQERKYNRMYTYDPNIDAVNFKEEGDLSAAPSYLRPSAAYLAANKNATPIATGSSNAAISSFANGGEIVANGNEVNILAGGKAKNISSSNHSSPMIEFIGNDHKQGGIPLEFGGNIAEVENKEVGWVDDTGTLNIFGKLKVPGTNQTFRKAAKDLGKQESKVDRTKSKYLDILNNSNPVNPYHESSLSTAKVMFKSLDKQSKDIAENKEALSSYQNLILSMTDQQKKMKYGGKLYAEGGPIDPNNPVSVQEYIDNNSGGSAPLKAEDFIEVSNKYGVPLDLILAQAQQESNFGTRGRAVRTKNIFNVGNTDNGAEANQGSWKKGLESFAKLISTQYTKTPGKVSTQEILNNNFTRPGRGGRYATDPQYTQKIASILDKINPNNTYSYINSYSGNPEDNLRTPSAATNIPGSDNLSVASNVSPLTDQGRVNTTNALTNFSPNYQPINNAGAPVVNTEYGPAARNPSAFSDNSRVSAGGRERQNQSPLALEQIAPELLGIATNNRTPVPLQSYQPELSQTFDISYQLGRNQNQATFNQAAQLATQAGNIDALSQLAAQKYQADQAYNVQEVQGNAQQRLQTYNQNTATLNDAELKNLAALENQQNKQAQADFNTQAQDMAAFRSISGKVSQNNLENKTYNAYANLFKHYGFDKNGNVTFDKNQVSTPFTAGEAQSFGLMAAQKGVESIMNTGATKTTTTYDGSGNVKKITSVDDALKEFNSIMGSKTLSEEDKRKYLNNSNNSVYKNLYPG